MKNQQMKKSITEKRSALPAKDARETIVYERDGSFKLELLAVGGIVWMTMQQIGEVFGVDRSVVGKHIRNIYATGELKREATWAKIAQVQVEGVRQVMRNIEYYNLDMTIAVGYRVNSLKAARFRIWATDVLKRYLNEGSATNARFAKLEGRMTTVERAIDSIVYTLMPPLRENRKPIGFHP